MKVEKAKLVKGLIIEFTSEEKINTHAVVELLTGDDRKPFYVREVETTGSKLLCRANECGYFAKQLGENKDFDVRSVIGCKIEIVKEKERIENIREQSSWC